MANEIEELATGLVCGSQVQYDRSGGQGHRWVDADLSDIPNIAEEIAAEILDGGVEDCGGFVASNGCHYRW